jgi:hypothetical protein
MEDLEKMIVRGSGQVEIVSANGRLYLYTHNAGTRLVQRVHDALSRKENWNDPDYLARMIFCSMIPSQESGGSKGYGIGTEFYISAEITIVVDVTAQMIRMDDVVLPHEKQVLSFKDFTEKFLSQASL